MNVDENDFRRRYAELSDEGLLSINRDELVDIARQCYDQELARRGLQYDRTEGQESSSASDEVAADEFAFDEFISAATYLFPDEAEVARSLLRSGGVLCYLENDHILAKVWQWNFALGGLRLMVPASSREEAVEILREELTEGRQEVQDGIEEQFQSNDGYSFELFAHGRNGLGARAMLAIAVLCAPALETIHLLYIRR